MLSVMYCCDKVVGIEMLWDIFFKILKFRARYYFVSSLLCVVGNNVFFLIVGCVMYRNGDGVNLYMYFGFCFDFLVMLFLRINVMVEMFSASAFRLSRFLKVLILMIVGGIGIVFFKGFVDYCVCMVFE